MEPSKKVVPLGTRCPACGGPLRPSVLTCSPCNLRIEADFQSNEFATLGPEDLHFLRIFVQTEGHIRDMESALGISYPTVKARLAELKNRLQMERPAPPTPQTPPPSTEPASILRELEEGAISVEEALKRIRGK
jgi:hypothetical protein